MGTRSASQTALAILAAFLEERTWMQAALARRVGVQPATIRTHLLELQREGVPLERQEEDNQVYWSLPGDWVPAGVVLDQGVLKTLLRVLVRTPASSARTALVQRLTRSLTQPEAWRRRLDVVLPDRHVDAGELLDALEDSATEERALHVYYYTASRGDLGWRVISVQRVVGSERFAGYCHREHKLKWFRVDGVQKIESKPPTDGYHKVADAVVEELVKTSVHGFAGHDGVRDLVFRVRSPESRWVLRNLPGEGATHVQLGDGVRVTLRTSAVLVLARYVVGLGEAAEAESPELRRAVLDLARGALAASGGAPPSTRTEDQSPPTSPVVGGGPRSEPGSDSATVAPTSPREE